MQSQLEKVINKKAATLTNPVFKKINDRLKLTLFTGIDLEKHIDFDDPDSIKVGSSTLEGVFFRTQDSRSLKSAFRDARDISGGQAFANLGATTEHWPLRLSFGVTTGTGFREITRLPLQLPELSQMNRGFAGQFANTFRMPNLTSLHAAVSPQICNVHIDEMGFVWERRAGDRGYWTTADSGHHFFNEYLLKTKIKELLPDVFFGSALDHINLVLPNSSNGFSKRLGVNLEAQLGSKTRITITATCGMTSCRDRSITIGVDGNL